LESKNFYQEPSKWIMEQIESINIVKNNINILDFASGYGRHSVKLANEGKYVTCIDKDQEKLNFYKDLTNIQAICFDLENNNKWPLKQQGYDIVIVTNYLYRPKIKDLGNLVNENGYLLYETFSEGNEKYGRPKNSNYLLKERELIDLFENTFDVIDYFNGFIKEPKESCVQRCNLKKRTAKKTVLKI
jgi:hypothetical protein